MSKSALTEVGRRAYSYQTCIRDVLPDGRTIGNNTKYSMTTSHHQSKAGVRGCDVVVTCVPVRTDDLAGWYTRLSPEQQEDVTSKEWPRNR